MRAGKGVLKKWQAEDTALGHSCPTPRHDIDCHDVHIVLCNVHVKQVEHQVVYVMLFLQDGGAVVIV